ncbi:hypothetical protein [Maritimibacter sp. UBA3975]|mgnify:CR=1 FL=1|uniref:hypothetical protein n=1 Tax=Maritimibacter sp. UBA3975 TaxID=1946833 RepID=UPI000C090544|nr:hypothetical protein [Maritimibacter sp. UBA3975]MAM61080.1 hypothetical protein [Maritimibacter sp.]|tara:strand:- start:2768 stop:3412 length:645 start_codon:yes stop_codon:yes gene_type:complete
MQLEDVVFYGLGAAFVAGVSGFVDFSSLFGSKDAEDEPPDAEATRANPDEAPNPRTGEYQSTLAYILQDEQDSLLALRSAEQDTREAEPEPEIAADPVVAGFEDGNIFGEVSATEEDALYEEAESGTVIEAYDLSDPDAAAARIDGYEAETEALEIEYLPEFDAETGEPITPVVSVGYDAEADLTTIALDGEAIAELPGDAGLRAEDITLRPMA